MLPMACATCSALVPAGNCFDGTGAAEIMADGAPFERAKLNDPHVAEIVAKRINGIAGTGPVAKGRGCG